MSTYNDTWFDLNELPDDHFCDDCVGKQIPERCIPILLLDPKTPGDMPTFKTTGFISRRFSCCFCRLLSHMVSPDMLEGGEVGLSFSISRYQTGMKLVAAPFRIDGGASLPTCGTIQVSDDRSRISSTIDVDYGAIKKVLSNCEEEHGKQPDDIPLMPLMDRPITLIDVLEDCVVAASSRHYPYVALSYVWGKVTMFGLTSANRPQLEQPGALRGVYSQVPSIILDAITFTKTLGERYLWVDVLCIPQDDLQVRIEQIRQMDIIFGSAKMTIISYSTADAKQGLPGVRPGTMLPRMSQKILGTRFETGFLNFRDKTRSMQGSSKHLTRAWTFQEVLLSSRSVYFGYREIIFACSHSRLRGITSGEDDSYGLGRVFGQDGFVRDWGGDDLDEAMKAYASLLPEYTEKDMTELTDRLSAFVGCLARLRPALGFYIQGLPSACFTKALMWHPDRRKNRLQVRNAQFASWSWAGWRGSCMMGWAATDLEMENHKVYVSSKHSPQPMLLFTKTSPNLAVEVYGYQPDLRVRVHFEARTVAVSRFSAKGISDARYDHYALRLYAADDKWCGVLDSVEPETFNRACDDGLAQRWELVLMAKSTATGGYRTQYIGFKQYDHRKQCMAEVLLIQWHGAVAERLTSGRIHLDAFEAAEPHVKKIVLQ